MRIIVGLSGGVDSAYAAYSLISAGHSVEGAVSIMHDYTDTAGAERVAAALGIPLHKIDCRAEFSDSVISRFIDDYSHARTPNPCVVCNSEVKFASLMRLAERNGFDGIATGHYATVRRIGERYAVARAADLSKDQTYMLYRLPQAILSRLILPLADAKKSDIRLAADRLGLVPRQQSESQEICFIPSGDYAGYIEERLGKFPSGDFVDREGRVLGRHEGIIRYTLGQRRGLGVAYSSRLYVNEIDIDANRVVLAPESASTDAFSVRDVVYMGMSPEEAPTERELEVKVRYAARPVRAHVSFDTEGGALVRLSLPQHAVTPGQSAVFYDGDTVMAGGVIVNDDATLMINDK